MNHFSLMVVFLADLYWLTNKTTFCQLEDVHDSRNFPALNNHALVKWYPADPTDNTLKGTSTYIRQCDVYVTGIVHGHVE